MNNSFNACVLIIFVSIIWNVTWQWTAAIKYEALLTGLINEIKAYPHYFFKLDNEFFI